MKNTFWNDRYSAEDYAYGKGPNLFFKEQIDKLTPGKILLLGEGEGRNAVYAAKIGWKVTAVDFSEQAKTKALALAKENNVSIEYIVSNLGEYKFPINEFDNVSLVYIHVPSDIREKILSSVILSLKKGGTVIAEVFNKKQIENNTGGPKEIDNLYSLDDFKKHLGNLRTEIFSEFTIELTEGKFHNGKSDIIRFVGFLD